MALSDNLPVSEALGVFVGITGFDWLAEGRADPVKAAIAAVAAGAIIGMARWMLKNRRR
jgi:hypothetical protein